jgi:hypothetical protein
MEFTPLSRDDTRAREVCELETRNPHIVAITTWGGNRNEYDNTKLRERWLTPARCLFREQKLVL